MERRLLYLGDIHGNFNIIKNHIEINDITNADLIQVGDFGVGFKLFSSEKDALSLINDILIERDVHVYAIRGNHDYKPYFDNDPFNLSNIHLVADYSVLTLCDENILFIGGAVSIDRLYRYTPEQRDGDHSNYTIGRESWWKEERFYFNKQKLMDMRNIDIVITHTAPEYCAIDNRMGYGDLVESYMEYDPLLKDDLKLERDLMTDTFEILKKNNNIKAHYYGHFHRSDVLYLDHITHRLLDVSELFEMRDEE